MNHLIRLALVAGLVASATAQSVATHPLPAPVTAASVSVRDAGQSHYWACFLSGTAVLGGSFVSNKSSLLNTGNPLTAVNNATATQRPVVVLETLPGGLFQYHAMSVRGAWVPAPLQLMAPAATVEFAEHMLLLDDGAGLILVFNAWRSTWQFQPYAAGLLTTHAERSCITAFDGATLYGFSAFGELAVQLAAPGGATFIQGVGAGLHSGIIYQTAPDQYQVFHALSNQWTLVQIPAGQTVGLIEYDENIVMFQVGNTALLVSGYTANVTAHTFTDLPRVLTGNVVPAAPTYLIEDQIAIFQDTLTGEGVIYRAIDDTVFTFTGLLAGDSRKIENEMAGFLRNGDTYQLVSGVARGTPVATMTIPAGFARVTDKVGDADVVVVTTEPAAYGYSSITGTWSRTPITGTLRTAEVDAQDFAGCVPTSTTIYGFSTRQALWRGLSVASPTAPVAKEDGVWSVVDSGSRWCFGSESIAWVGLPAAATPFAAGLQDDYAYEIADDPAGPGSIVKFFSRITDQWLQRTIGTRINSLAGQVVIGDEALIVVTPTELLTFSAFGDLTCQQAWPMDNAPYHAFAGGPAVQFLATGPAFALNYVAFGYGRATVPTSIPPVLGQLLLPLAPAPIVVAVGGFDARGVIQDSIALPAGLLPLSFHLQNVNLDLAGPTLSFGQGLFPFQVH